MNAGGAQERRCGWGNLLLVLASFLVSAAVLEVLLRLFLPVHSLYYRPHEMLITYDYRRDHAMYKPRRTVSMLVPHGDLVAIDPRARDLLAEPRFVHFRTDSLGFRNDHDYQKEKFVLVGDSFVVGNGNSQEDMISSQLRKEYGISVYNLAVPGALKDYVRFIEEFQKSYKDFKVLLFVFEGNDFPSKKTGHKLEGQKNQRSSWLRIYRKEIQQAFKELLLYRYLFSAFHKLRKNPGGQEPGEIAVFRLREQPSLYMGFLTHYLEKTREPTYDGGEEFVWRFAGLRDRILGIFFVPTKFRVYHEWLELPDPQPLPHARWQWLQAQAAHLGLPAVDLTGPLKEESRRLLPQGKLTFWRDDTHWNKNGMAVAARAVRDFLRQQGEVP